MALDIFDELELSPEDKILLSEDFKNYLIEQIKKEVGKLPIDKIISSVVKKEVEEKSEQGKALEKSVSDKLEKAKKDGSSHLNKAVSVIKGDIQGDLKAAAEKLKKAQDEFMDKMREKYDSLRTEIISQPRYEFGGYPPPGGVLPIQSGGVDTWRIIIDGDDLSFQYNDSGNWTEAYRVTRNQ